MRITHAAATGLAVAALILTGCGSDDDGEKKAKDTTCGDYLNMGSGDKKKTAEDALKSKGRNDPSGVEVTAAQGAIRTYCELGASTDDKIINALDGLDTGN